MKRYYPQIKLASALALLLTPFLLLKSHAIPPRAVVEAAAEQDTGSTPPAAQAAAKAEAISIEKIEPTAPDEESPSKTAGWLGISTTEPSDALVSQLDLENGIGLVVTYVVTNGPAAEAGLQKNDVLIAFDDQSLVHPAQLRKLVRSRNAGDAVKIRYYRAAKARTVSVTLGNGSRHYANLEEGQHNLENGFHELHQQLKDLHLEEMIRDQLKVARDALGNLKMDPKVQEDIRQGMEEARKSLREALRGMTNSDPATSTVRKIFEDLVGAGVAVDNNASVTVRSSGKGVKSLVNTDDSGTIVIVTKPKLHLTAHDKEGNLLFDGEIETSSQRSQVPRRLWERVQPLVDKLNAGEAEEPEEKSGR
ncbi:MAG TPA: PDZ domain-containing protein [Candidatus Limnocylindrales bacterium]|jgi:hypothetical protein|nr:PDZ domain-containing protein [Candidatus Limnocylindrales bacterium]